MYGRVKGHACLIAAACNVCRILPNAVFVLIGDGEERPKLEEQIREAGLESNFVFLGRRSDVPELLACCDLSVLPSEAEGLPNSVLEAMAAGLPVIATCVGGNPEIIVDGINGLLVPPQDEQALAEAILRILQDAHLGRRLSQAGQERVRAKFGFDRLLAELKQLYDWPGCTSTPRQETTLASIATKTSSHVVQTRGGAGLSAASQDRI
jgi:glycosyltransferase involved in cell wall biosynthesis